MGNDAEAKVLRGLVEHEGRWIPIGEKIKLLTLDSEKLTIDKISDHKHDFEEHPFTEHETAAVARFAEALKGEETDTWSIPQTKLKNAILEAKNAEIEEAETAFDKYQKSQRRRRLIIIAVLLFSSISAFTFYFLIR